MTRGGWLILGAVVLYAIGKGASVLAAKIGVVLSDTREAAQMRNAVAEVWGAYGFDATITSSMDGEHMQGSKHYLGLAEDYRTNDLPDQLKPIMAKDVSNILGADFDVILEDVNGANEHLHIEYDPKG